MDSLDLDGEDSVAAEQVEAVPLAVPVACGLGMVPATPAQQAAQLLAMDDLRGDSLMIGRDAEVSRLVSLLRAGRCAVVTGERGVGKSRLLREAYEVLTGERRRLDPGSGRVLGPSPLSRVVLWIWQTTPHGDFLEEILTHLWARELLVIPRQTEAERAAMWQEARAEKLTLRQAIRQHMPNARSKRDAILASLRESPALIFLDSLERITPTVVAFLQALTEHAVLAVATPEIERRDYLRRYWAAFVRVDLEPLPKPAMERLVNHFLQTYPLYPSDRAMFRRQVLQAAGGNPGLLKSILADAQKQRQVTLAEIRELGRVDEADYFNLGPFYVFALIGFTLAKIILHGSGPAELYIVLSVFSVVMLMMIRIFRVFFIFRPR